MRLHPPVPAALPGAGVQPQARSPCSFMWALPLSTLSSSRMGPAEEFSSPNTSGAFLSQHEAWLGFSKFLPAVPPASWEFFSVFQGP